MKTRELAEREWLDLHYSPDYITASQMPAVVGVDPYVSSFELFHRKRGDTHRDDADNLRFAVGHALEPVIAEEFSRIMGHVVVDLGPYTVAIHPVYDWLVSTPDFIAIVDGAKAPVEIKTTETNTEAARDFSACRVPIHYDVQVQMQMATMDAPFGYIAALRGLGSRGLDIIRVERDDELIEGCLRIGAKFLNDIAVGREPAPTGSDADAKLIARLHPADDGSTIELPEDGWLDRIERLDDLKRRAAEINEEIVQIENSLKNEIGDHTFAECGPWRFSFKTTHRKGYVVQDAIFRVLRKSAKK
ncbi:MAG TPA: YqaJ viral recombinase family protein [Candidatus Hydrogenedentes bacterium]|nr:YqaJ viral recombinase family protein [Candidatus Hydrogenedentota bacterium]HRT67092.1 YqaJ viral recombinase family protein [Candidatus Hydrogenedentota bacterium]